MLKARKSVLRSKDLGIAKRKRFNKREREKLSNQAMGSVSAWDQVC
jgi:hypothetical protein